MCAPLAKFELRLLLKNNLLAPVAACQARSQLSGGSLWLQANRAPTPERVLHAMKELPGLLHNMGFNVLSVPGFEADDVIATLCMQLGERGRCATIFSRDKARCLHCSTPRSAAHPWRVCHADHTYLLLPQRREARITVIEMKGLRDVNDPWVQDFKQLLQHSHVGVVHETSLRQAAKGEQSVELAETFREEYGFDAAFFADYLGIVGAPSQGDNTTVYSACSRRKCSREGLQCQSRAMLHLFPRQAASASPSEAGNIATACTPKVAAMP